MSRGEIDVKQWEDGWTIRVLGPVDLATPDGVESLGGRLPQTLIATLVIAAGRIVSIDHLIEVHSRIRKSFFIGFFAVAAPITAKIN